MNVEELAFIIILGVMVAFYLILIRPSQQEQKRHQQTIGELQIGDEVVTTSGFFAHITDIRTPEEGPVELTLDLGNGLEVRALTTAVIRRVAPAAEAVQPAAEKEDA